MTWEYFLLKEKQKIFYDVIGTSFLRKNSPRSKKDFQKQ